MNQIANTVIIGAGLAGANAADELRTRGYACAVTLIGAEPHPPYERPPLSKDLLLGTATPDSPMVHEAGWYAEHDIELITGTGVTGIDLGARRVELGDRRLPYDRLLLATGAQPRHLPPADRSGADVAYLRTLDDAVALRPRLTENLLIIGAGWIGLEVAAAARQAGGEVTIVETAALPLAGVLGTELASMFAGLHREHGVDLRLSTSVDAIEKNRVRLSDGYELTPDLILVAIGAEPDVALAREAGLSTGNGVLADATLRTSDPHVFAAGDVAAHDHPSLGRIRVEHWDNAIHQGRHAAGAMLGDDAAYTRQPYFFTDQYDLGMEYVGHSGPGDEVVIRGDPATRTVTALWLRDDRVIAGMHANDWDAIDPLRALIGREATARIRDTAIPLADIA